MCGRFVRTSPEEVIREAFRVTSTAAVELRPRYSIPPGENVAAVVADADGRRLGELRWGFLPASARSGSAAATVINARCETASRRFPDAFRKRRCLVVADGFYEWRRVGSSKIPHFVYLTSRRPFAFASLWNRTGADGVAACTILTCPPNDLVAELHDRMPVVLGPRSFDRWLDPTCAPADLESLLVPYPAEEMAAHPVSTMVNSARNDSAECIRPLAEGTLRLVPRPD